MELILSPLIPTALAFAIVGTGGTTIGVIATVVGERTDGANDNVDVG